MRGTHTPTLKSSLDGGIIPAYAGNTMYITHFLMPDWDHPRVCGEHTVFDVFFDTVSGSSPRMRGTRGGAAEPSRPVGIIPAYAGNTLSIGWSSTAVRDHPRVCGEHLPTASVFHPLTGSSPRMRGTRHKLFDGFDVRGIIPAYAGNTRPPCAPLAKCGDHPRVCGEHDMGLLSLP